MGFLVEDLIEGIKTRSFAPISQTTFQDSGLITLANDEMILNLVGNVMKVREDFFLTTKSVSLSSGKSRYPIPKRAIGNTLKKMWFIDSGGNYHNISRIDIEEKDLWVGSGNPCRFYFEGDEVVLLPTPNISGTLFQAYYANPSPLIATESCAKITGVSSVGGITTFTVDTDLTESLSNGSQVDILSAKAPYLLWAEEVSLSTITSGTAAVSTSSIVDELSSVEPQVGDYICPTGFANIPMFPQIFHSVLAQMGAVSILHSLGDLTKLKAAETRLARLEGQAMDLIKNRAESSPEYAKNRFGLGNVFT